MPNAKTASKPNLAVDLYVGIKTGLIAFPGLALVVAILWVLAWLAGFALGLIAWPFLSGFCLPVGC